jgi:hypothetical protein
MTFMRCRNAKKESVVFGAVRAQSCGECTTTRHVSRDCDTIDTLPTQVLADTDVAKKFQKNILRERRINFALPASLRLSNRVLSSRG